LFGKIYDVGAKDSPHVKISIKHIWKMSMNIVGLENIYRTVGYDTEIGIEL